MPYITIAYGWRAAFVITGSFSLIWLAVWLRTYRSPRQNKRVSPGDLAINDSDPPDTEAQQNIPWLRLLSVRETWAYAIAKFLIDPIWWMYLFWLPGFFADRYHLDLRSFGPPVVAVYIMSDIGSVAGGWLSSQLMKMGYSINGSAQAEAMLISCFAILPIVFAMYADNVWLAVGILGVATAAHQSFSANLYTMHRSRSVFPRSAVGSVIGIGGTLGAIGGMLMAKYTGYVLRRRWGPMLRSSSWRLRPMPWRCWCCRSCRRATRTGQGGLGGYATPRRALNCAAWSRPGRAAAPHAGRTLLSARAISMYRSGAARGPRRHHQHGHADHARAGHGAVIATPRDAGDHGCALWRRTSPARCSLRPMAERSSTKDVSVTTLAPAGHVLGSAQAVVRWKGLTMTVSGDYKRRRDPTCAGFEPVVSDVFISEATFGLARLPPSARHRTRWRSC